MATSSPAPTGTASTLDYLVERYGIAMTTAGVAEVLHRHPSHVRALCQRGELPGVLIGNRWHVPTARLAALLDGGDGNAL